MSRFSFRAIDPSNTMHRGEIDAGNAREAVDRLSRRGWTVITADEIHGTKPWRPPIAFKGLPIARGKASTRQFESLLTEWSYLLGIGLTIDQAVRFSISSHAATELGRLARAVETGLKSGRSLEEALTTAFPLLPTGSRAAIVAAEKSGRLPETLERLGSRLRSDRKFVGDLRSALLYPVFVLVTACSVLTVLLAFVVPSIADVVMQPDHALPWNAVLIFRAGLFVRDNGSALAATLAVAALIVMAGIRRPWFRGSVERLLIELPVAGDILVARDMAQFSRDLATQLQGGFPVVQAVATARNSLSRQVFRARADELRRKIAEGVRLSDAVAVCFGRARALPAFIRIGEENGRLANLLDHAADHYESEARRLLTHVSTLATPIVTILTGILVGTVVLSIMTALIGLNDIVQQ